MSKPKASNLIRLKPINSTDSIFIPPLCGIINLVSFMKATFSCHHHHYYKQSNWLCMFMCVWVCHNQITIGIEKMWWDLTECGFVRTETRSIRDDEERIAFCVPMGLSADWKSHLVMKKRRRRSKTTCSLP